MNVRLRIALATLFTFALVISFVRGANASAEPTKPGAVYALSNEADGALEPLPFLTGTPAGLAGLAAY